MSAPRNQCGACQLDFASVAAFDRHRVGVHAYTLTEGLRLDPPREDGRHCLSSHELRDLGFVLTERGLWQDAEKAAAARAHFG